MLIGNNLVLDWAAGGPRAAITLADQGDRLPHMLRVTGAAHLFLPSLRVAWSYRQRCTKPRCEWQGHHFAHLCRFPGG